MWASFSRVVQTAWQMAPPRGSAEREREGKGGGGVRGRDPG